MRLGAALTAMTLGLAVVSGVAHAQEGPGGQPPAGDRGGERGVRGGDRGGDRGGRGNFDPAQFQQRMMDRFKEQLKVPDEEWQVLQPKIQKVLTAQRNVRAGEGFGRGGGPGGGPGGPGGPGGRGGDNAQREAQPQSEVAKASADLRDAVRGETPSEQDIEAKLAALRAAREKAAEELKTARADLQGVVTVQQEAVLVLAGLLE
jgi:hypothetical protein